MDKSEKLSFFKADHIFGANEIPDAPIDVNVKVTETEVALSNGTFVQKGRWYSAPPQEVVNVTLNAVEGLHTIMTDGTVYDTPRLKRDIELPSTLEGRGVLQPYKPFPVQYNDTPDDFYDEAQKQYFLFGAPPKCTSITGTRLVTEKGVIITASNQYGAAYTMINALNRKVSNVADGMLGSGPMTATFEFPAGNPAEIIGWRYKILRSDGWTTTHMVLEYQSPGSSTWVILDTKVNFGGGLITVMFPGPVIAQNIRWRSTLPGQYGGIGQIDFITKAPGVRASAAPLRFAPEYFKTVETEEAITIEPSRFEEVVDDSTAFNIANYHKLEYIPPVGRRYQMKAGATNIVRWNTVTRDATGISTRLPKLKLKRGRWYYKYNLALVNTGKTRAFLSHAGTRYPLSPTISGIVQVAGNRAVNLTDEGVLNIYGDLETTLSVECESATGGALSQVPTGTPSACLELWYLDEDLPVTTAPVKPSPELVPAAFQHYGGALNYGTGSQLFDGLLDKTTAQETGYWYRAADHLIIGVQTCFRIWRCTVNAANGPIGNLKITRFDDGEYEMLGAHLPLTKTAAKTWELMTETLPPGVYKFAHAGAERNDGEWFIEEMAKPAQWGFGSSYTRVTLAMASANDAGQQVTESSFYSGGYAGFYALSSIPTGGGWISSAATDFSVTNRRLNDPMVNNTAANQIASASSVHAEYQPWYALGAVASEVGWVSAMVGAPSPAAPQWIAVRLKEKLTIDKYTIVNRTYTGVAGYTCSPKDWQFQISNDGANWTTVHTVAGDVNNAPSQVREFTLDAPVVAKHVRLFITGRNAAPATAEYVCVGLFTVSVFGPKPEYLQVTFAATQKFDRYQITNRLYADSNASHSPQDWKLRGKLIGGDWEDIHTVVGDTRNTYGLTREFVLDRVYEYDIVQLYITKKNAGTGGEAGYSYLCLQHFKLGYVVDGINQIWL